MRHQDWPERLARFVRSEHDDWAADWLAECGGAQGEEIDPRLAQRGDLVEMADGMRVCVGKYAAGPLLTHMSEARRAWRIV